MGNKSKQVRNKRWQLAELSSALAIDSGAPCWPAAAQAEAATTASHTHFPMELCAWKQTSPEPATQLPLLRNHHQHCVCERDSKLRESERQQLAIAAAAAVGCAATWQLTRQ